MSNVGTSSLLMLVLLTYSCTKSVQTKLQKEHTVYYRLPKHTQPTHYNIQLRTEVARSNMTFTGHSIINLTVLRDTNALVFHARHLFFDENQTSLHDEYQQMTIPVLKHSYHPEKHFTILHFESALRAGRYVLSLKFTGMLNHQPFGFYRTYYLDSRKEPRWLGATYFQPTNARYAFPCWDEPALKATFDISIQHDRNYTAISNMPILHQTDAGDMIETTFQTSPVMSTYLVAFVVSDFEYVTNEYKNFTVWSWKDRIQEAVYARDVGQIILRQLEEFTGIPFAMPKMDQISIPETHVRAMENWGLITYSPEDLLYSNESSDNVQLYQTSVMAHELAHQWFGNLVSPVWWEHAWLNEGFATYFEYYIPNKINASWKAMDQFFIATQLLDAFSFDARVSRPLNQSAQSPIGILNLFDPVTYVKSACIIRMLSHMLTEKVFQEGLRIYLRSRSFTYATPNHLFNSLQEAANKSRLFSETFSVKRIMNTWVRQAGYPVINVIRNYQTSSLVIKQKRFSLQPLEEEYTRNYKWYIPITYATQENLNFNNTFPRIIVEPQKKSSKLSIDLSPASWIIVNNQGAGYYRINYDVKNWLLIANYLKTEEFKNIHKLNRAQLIDDAWKMAGTGGLKYSVALEITDYLRQEHEHELWAVAFPNFQRVNTMLLHTAYNHTFQTYITRMMDNLVDTIKYEEQPTDSLIHLLVKNHVINWDCTMGVRSCRSFTEQKLKQWLSNPTSDLPDTKLIFAILCGGLREADHDTWNAVFERCLNSTHQERSIMMAALGCSLSDEILTGYLRMSLDPDTGVELHSVVNAMRKSGNAKTINVILNFMFNNIAMIEPRSLNNLISLVQELIREMGTVGQLIQLYDFVSRHNMHLDTRTLMDSMRKDQQDAISIGKWLEGRDLSSS